MPGTYTTGVYFVLTPEEKRRLVEAATARGVSQGSLLRAGIALVTGGPSRPQTSGTKRPKAEVEAGV